jgi:hypothetical protein
MKKFLIAFTAVTSLLVGFGGSATAAPAPAPAAPATVVPAPGPAPAATPDVAFPTYLVNDNSFPLTVLHNSADITGRVLPAFANTRDAFGWNGFYAIVVGAHACILSYYNSGELGWHFWHQFQSPPTGTWIYQFDSAFNWDIVVHKNTTCS